MAFAYYNRLSRRDQATYRRSDATSALTVPGVEVLRPSVEALRQALAAEDGEAVARAAFQVSAGICLSLGARPPRLEIHAVRPRGATHELHGLYFPASPPLPLSTADAVERGRVQVPVDGQPAIRVWMRTARKGRVVAFRTSLRTLLHELVHHLDYEVLALEDSFHTEGFFRRESSLFRQLVQGEGEPSAEGP